jgi:hypothetical protein
MSKLIIGRRITSILLSQLPVTGERNVHPAVTAVLTLGKRSLKGFVMINYWGDVMHIVM